MRLSRDHPFAFRIKHYVFGTEGSPRRGALLRNVMGFANIFHYPFAARTYLPFPATPGAAFCQDILKGVAFRSVRCADEGVGGLIGNGLEVMGFAHYLRPLPQTLRVRNQRFQKLRTESNCLQGICNSLHYHYAT